MRAEAVTAGAPRLTAEQRRAVEAPLEGDVCITAGPGSGKTFVLVERIRRLVEVEEVPGSEILAITFTRKAAHGMYGRLRKLAAPGARARAEYERARISTIDAFCKRLISEHAIEADIDPGFGMIDEAEASFELRRGVREALDELCRDDPDAAHVFLRSFKKTGQWVVDRKLTKIHEQIAGLVEKARAWGEEGLRAGVDEAADRRWLCSAVEQAIERYQSWKRERNAFDFSDLVIEALKLLESDVEPRTRYRFILVDENQDTNPLQDRLVRALARRRSWGAPRVFAVGDLNQSIYSFRNATPEVFEQFRERVRESGGRLVDLRENFRSRQQILDAVHALLGPGQGFPPEALIARRRFAPATEPSLELMMVTATDGEDPKKREARWIARRILELRESLTLGEESRRARWKDFAVLPRKNNQVDTISAALGEAGIPFARAAGRGFFEAPEVADVIRLLSVLDNPRDEISLAAVMRSPFVGVSDETLLRLKADGRNLADALDRPPALGAEQGERLRVFRERLKRWRRSRDDASIEILLGRIFLETGFEAWLAAQPDGRQRIANVRELARIAARPGADGPRSFHELLDRIEEMRDGGAASAEAGTPQDDADAVQVTTIHKAKGLEFPVVLLPAINSPEKNSTEPLLYSTDRGIGIERVEAEESILHEKLKSEQKSRQEAESLRVFYVAMTRAEERLVLSCSRKKMIDKRGWAKRLPEGLGVNFKTAPDNIPRIVERNGVRCRVLFTDRDPEPIVAEGFREQDAAAEPVEPEAPAAQADSEAAVTSVALFADCPRKYYLSRYLGLEERNGAVGFRPSNNDSDSDLEADAKEATELGRAVHDALAGQGDRADLDAAALRLVETFENSELGLRAAAAPALREKGVVFPLGEFLLRGRIDLWFEDAEGGVLVDYKTDRVTPAEAPGRAAGYALQLQLYAHALRSGGRRVDRGVLYFLRPDVTVEVDLNERALDQARAKVEALFCAQRTISFPLAPGERCRSCPHFGVYCDPPLGGRQT